MSSFIVSTLRRLEKITTSAAGCTRIAYTDAEQQAHDLVWDVMSEIDGLVRVSDAAGNMFIVPEGAVGSSDPILLTGSHVDTVIEGGWLDGTLGVVAAMHAVRELASDGAAHPRAGVVVFRDEEGVRFNTGLFGSSVFAGICTRDDLEVADREGVTVREVVPDPDGCLEYVPPITPGMFLECHIEQGIRLSESGTPVGVVDGIIGIRRYELVATGQANHAGTTEMSRRQDALVPIARIVSDLPPLVEGLDNTVITCGRMTVGPGAPNIVPGDVRAIVEIRGSDTETIERVGESVRDIVTQVRARHPAVGIDMRQIVDVAPMPTDDILRFQLLAALEGLNIDPMIMPSMAGHDTQHAMHRCPAGMFFIPSIDGISHNPDENSTEADIDLAADVMAEWVRRCVTTLS